ncbi:FAD-binding oxidoreductase [Paucibacter sp. TC2R-5]|uniref:NAD(P)/FAD-dependent oxidoreductase n=1 Tax=Paucibacter sp. TC2R-5 TaxID=2893555 RepID=UPI0021E4FB9B|nr:FAD-dependent oxidoreductase [Paucibacter sp. TC2R-5]MCV2361504.1 FAD-binding oxidoreductase [Paucibacter sp. TC2R-5]
MKQSRSADVLIVGAGIIGAACARAYARQGLSVCVIEPGAIGGGATAAAMGHLLVVDDEAGGADAEFQLTRRSQQLWQQWLDENSEHPALAEHQACGTLWIAADAEELALAERKQGWLAARGLAAEMLGATDLARAEPMLRQGLAGAMRVPGDARVYPPKVAARWLAEARAELIEGQVLSFDGHGVVLADGRRFWGALTVLCAGLAAQAWLPPGWLIPKKGQLAITQRYPGMLNHQLVELGYIKKAHLSDQDTVSFNVQPRPGGQLLIGSSRQIGRSDRKLDPAILQDMLRQACSYLPGLRDLSLLRCWTGVRPASRDGQPLIGAHPELARVWLATGHEGLGITTSLATAELLVDLSLGATPLLDAGPFSPSRFL